MQVYNGSSRTCTDARQWTDAGVERGEPSGRYRLGTRIYALAILEQGEAVLIDRVEVPGPPHASTLVGKRMGLRCTAPGKALIAHLPETQVEDVRTLAVSHPLGLTGREREETAGPA
jgi:DNA-binding IclR family transcriptional regulator